MVNFMFKYFMTDFTVAVQLSLKEKFLLCIPGLSCVHELWAVTKVKRSLIQITQMSFLHMVSVLRHSEGSQSRAFSTFPQDISQTPPSGCVLRGGAHSENTGEFKYRSILELLDILCCRGCGEGYGLLCLVYCLQNPDNSRKWTKEIWKSKKRIH